jgi:hypothetical protein
MSLFHSPLAFTAYSSAQCPREFLVPNCFLLGYDVSDGYAAYLFRVEDGAGSEGTVSLVFRMERISDLYK